MWRQKIVKLSHVLCLALFWPAAALVLWGELRPHPSTLEQEFWDKSLHFTAYMGLAGLGTLAANARRTPLIILGVALLGGALEIIQGMIGRDMSLYDEVANSLGAITGGLLSWLFLYLLQKMPQKAKNSRKPAGQG